MRLRSLLGRFLTCKGTISKFAFPFDSISARGGTFMLLCPPQLIYEKRYQYHNTQKGPDFTLVLSSLAPSAGFEPTIREPESLVLSTTLRGHV